jgi:hypothetical protein
MLFLYTSRIVKTGGVGSSRLQSMLLKIAGSTATIYFKYFKVWLCGGGGGRNLLKSDNPFGERMTLSTAHEDQDTGP